MEDGNKDPNNEERKSARKQGEEEDPEKEKESEERETDEGNDPEKEKESEEKDGSPRKSRKDEDPEKEKESEEKDVSPRKSRKDEDPEKEKESEEKDGSPRKSRKDEDPEKEKKSEEKHVSLRLSSKDDDPEKEKESGEKDESPRISRKDEDPEKEKESGEKDESPRVSRKDEDPGKEQELDENSSPRMSEEKYPVKIKESEGKDESPRVSRKDEDPGKEQEIDENSSPRMIGKDEGPEKEEESAKAVDKENYLVEEVETQQESEYHSALDLEAEYKKELARRAAEGRLQSEAEQRRQKEAEESRQRRAVETRWQEETEESRPTRAAGSRRQPDDKRLPLRPQERRGTILEKVSDLSLARAEDEETQDLREMRRSIEIDMQLLRRRTVELEETKRKVDSQQKKLEWQQKNKEKGHYEEFGFFDKPKKKTWGEFFYDRDDKKIMSRTCLEWLRVLLFYIAFFGILAILFAICFYIFLRAIVPKDVPLDSHWIMPQPGLSVFPSEAYGMCLLGSNMQSKLDLMRVDDAMGTYTLKLQPHKDATFTWDRNRVCFMNRLKFMFNRFLEPYKNNSKLVQFGNCNEKNLYGFLNNTPCFFLKINRIYNFRFQTYKKFSEIPGDFPFKLREHLEKNLSESKLEGKAFLDCSPTPLSRYKVGNISYWPDTQEVDVSKYFFDKQNKIGPQNLLPLVTIQLLNPRLWTSIGLVCKIWAKNIEIVDDNDMYLMGTTRFYFNIKDSKDTTSQGKQVPWEILEFPEV